MIGKPDALKWMGRQGRKLIDRVYNWGYVADKTIEMYKKL